MNSDEDEDFEKSPLPKYLERYVVPYSLEFWISPSFDPALVSLLMYEGFLPIASRSFNQYYLLPKMHVRRCIINWNDFHVPKSARKKSSKWRLKINTSFDEVVSGCHQQHGMSWLHPPIVEAFKVIYNQGDRGMRIDMSNFGISRSQCVVYFYSVELWNEDTGELSAGELGYSVGSLYTSLTGFYTQSGSGTMQLIALGKKLELCGFEAWDLGMGMAYKYSLGAVDIKRNCFMDLLHRCRRTPRMIDLTEVNTKDLLQR